MYTKYVIFLHATLAQQTATLICLLLLVVTEFQGEPSSRSNWYTSEGSLIEGQMLRACIVLRGLNWIMIVYFMIELVLFKRKQTKRKEIIWVGRYLGEFRDILKFWRDGLIPWRCNEVWKWSWFVGVILGVKDPKKRWNRERMQGQRGVKLLFGGELGKHSMSLDFFYVLLVGMCIQGSLQF